MLQRTYPFVSIAIVVPALATFLQLIKKRKDGEEAAYSSLSCFLMSPRDKDTVVKGIISLILRGNPLPSFVKACIYAVKWAPIDTHHYFPSKLLHWHRSTTEMHVKY